MSTDLYYRLKALQALWAVGEDVPSEELPTLDDLREDQSNFPADAVTGKVNVLCLFSAMLCGRNDVIYVHDASPRSVTLVDRHKAAMETMRRLYPKHWVYWPGDYREFLLHSEPRVYDLVVADQPPELGIEVAIRQLAAIARLAADRFTFIVNFWPETCTELGADRLDLPGLSRGLSERSGLIANFREMSPRWTGLDWAVIDLERPTNGPSAR